MKLTMSWASMVRLMRIPGLSVPPTPRVSGAKRGVAAGEGGELLAPLVGGLGEAVEEDDGIARPLLQVVHAQVGGLDVEGLHGASVGCEQTQCSGAPGTQSPAAPSTRRSRISSMWPVWMAVCSRA